MRSDLPDLLLEVLVLLHKRFTFDVTLGSLKSQGTNAMRTHEILLDRHVRSENCLLDILEISRVSAVSDLRLAAEWRCFAIDQL